VAVRGPGRFSALDYDFVQARCDLPWIGHTYIYIYIYVIYTYDYDVHRIYKQVHVCESANVKMHYVRV